MTCSDVANLFGGSGASAPPPSAPPDTFYFCILDAQLRQMMKGGRTTVPSLPSSVTLTGP
jgi:hypothetical protein